MYNILVCDDEKDIVSALRIYLTSEGYEVYEAYNGREALDILKGEATANSIEEVSHQVAKSCDAPEIHLVLLDVMMPVLDGIQTLSKIREISNVPVIFLTAKSEDTDKILGLNVGADDYVTKPFNPVELQARVKSQLRRYMMLGGMTKRLEETEGQQQVKNEDEIAIGPITLNDRSKEVTLDGELVNLTRTEYDILYLLMKNPGKVYSPSEIYREVWQGDAFGAENTVAVHIRHLREKLEYNPAEPRFLKVIWGRGYKMEG